MTSAIPTRDEDRKARFSRVCDLVIEPVRRYLARRADASTAEDVLSETLLVLWRKQTELPHDDELIPWVIGIARLQLANAQRSARRQDRLVARIITVDPPVESSTSTGTPEDTPTVQGLGAEAVHEALAALRPSDAELLRLWSWEELTVPQIATVLSVTENAVSIRLHRAKKKLAVELERIRMRKTGTTAGHDQVQEGEHR